MGTCSYCKIRHPDFYCPVEVKIEETAYNLYEWLIDHKIRCFDKNCLCNTSTPVDSLCDLFDKTGIIVLAEALKLSDERIREIVPSWKGWSE